MKTAVEWLTGLLMNGNTIDNKIIQQALEMEKDQIEKAFESGYSNGYSNGVCYDIDESLYDSKTLDKTQYYNETFKK